MLGDERGQLVLERVVIGVRDRTVALAVVGVVEALDLRAQLLDALPYVHPRLNDRPPTFTPGQSPAPLRALRSAESARSDRISDRRARGAPARHGAARPTGASPGGAGGSSPSGTAPWRTVPAGAYGVKVRVSSPGGVLVRHAPRRVVPVVVVFALTVMLLTLSRSVPRWLGVPVADEVTGERLPCR